ncbi:MAG: HD-GYP domain-containing protein, partial [Actinomycetota bacterium]|nr:HD-GYP domain-containing protein [Actinomycetota bacterium]
MGKRSSRQEIAYLPLVLCATFVVTVCPVILVWWLRDSGAVTSVWAGIAIGVAGSFGASFVGAALWKRGTGSRDVLFGEVMLWGWVQRWRAERRLATATDVLGLRHGPRRSVAAGRLTQEERAGLLTQLASALEVRDPYTHGHSRRVARHASNIAKRMGLPTAEVAKIRTAGVIHDVGKVKIPAGVLRKEGKLTDAEFEVVKRHPVEGATMISTLGDDELTAIVRHHHERLDGTGYPDRLAGEAIPLGARIIAVADTFDAITSTRPYRSAHAHKEALGILKAEAGAQLDPDAVRAFCSYYTGRRGLALWTILAHGPERLASWVGGGLSSAKAASAANVMATATTAAATAAVAGAALGPLVEAPVRSD